MLLAGEPGIGKSRLVRALIDRLQGEPHTRLHCRCSPLHASSPLYPVIDQLERAAGLTHEDQAEQRLDKLEGCWPPALDQLSPRWRRCSRPCSPSRQTGRYPALTLAPQAQRERTLAALLGQLEGLASTPAGAAGVRGRTLERSDLDRAAGPDRRAAAHAARPHDRQLPAGISCRHGRRATHATTLSLDRLDAADARAVVDQLRQATPLSAEAIDAVVAKADGVPLFLEELTKAVLEASRSSMWTVGPAARAVALTSRRPCRIPWSRGSIVWRRCARWRRRQPASGREFDHALLAAISPLPAPRLAEALDLLVAADLLFRVGGAGSGRYSFKHALVRDIAYATLLNSRRQQLHARIVAVIEARFPERASAQPQLLAQHCAEAGLIGQAIEYWHRAGLVGRPALGAEGGHDPVPVEALALIPALPDTPDRAARELDLQVALGATLLASKGEAAPEIGRAYRRARELYPAHRQHRPQARGALGLVALPHEPRRAAARPRARGRPSAPRRAARQRGRPRPRASLLAGDRSVRRRVRRGPATIWTRFAH